jgi:hypothetical protein
LDAALTIDAVEVIAKGLDSIQDSNPDIFREVFRRGKVYNNDTIGLDCKNDLPVPWIHGNMLINKFKQVFESVLHEYCLVIILRWDHTTGEV